MLGLLVLLLLAVAAGGSPVSAAVPSGGTVAETGGASATTLNGSVGPGFDISLDGTDGITAGDYTLVVNDQSTAHNFHLTGPGVNVKTDVSQTGTKTFTVTLKKGTYRFVCDPHASQMKGSFKVS